MKMKKVLAILCAGVMMFSLAACGGDDKETDNTPAEDNKEEEKEEEKDEPADDQDADDDQDAADAPEFDGITYDAETKEVTFTAEVNGKYFTEPTRHAISFKGGGNGESSILRGNVDNVDFHDALIEIGAKAGNDLTLDDMKSSVEDNIVNTGDVLEVYLKWDGQDEIAYKDVIKASEDFEWNVVFAGNREAAESTGAGCVLCVDSCAAGITTNAALPVGSTGDDGIKFYGNDEVLPEDGTEVTVIFRIAQ